MGNFVAITCGSCAFADELQLGCGEAGVCYSAMRCLSCRRIGAVAVEVAPHAWDFFAPDELQVGCCRHCGGEELLEIDLEGAMGTLQFAETDQLCLACGRGMLSAKWAGLWD